MFVKISVIDQHICYDQEFRRCLVRVLVRRGHFFFCNFYCYFERNQKKTMEKRRCVRNADDGFRQNRCFFFLDPRGLTEILKFTKNCKLFHVHTVAWLNGKRPRGGK